MALVKFGSLVSDISGRVGGVVFARNRGGAVVRNGTIPLNPQSAAQTAVRSSFADLATRYATVLTPSQRDGWTAFAEQVPVPNRLGEPRFLTANQSYIRSNSVLQLAGGAVVDDPPTSFTAGPTIEATYAVDATADTLDVLTLGGYNPATSGILALLISVSAPVNPGVNFFKGPFRRIFGGAPLTLAGLPVDLPLPFPVSAGQKIFIRMAPVTLDGRPGVPVITPFLVA